MWEAESGSHIYIFVKSASLYDLLQLLPAVLVESTLGLS